jgi:hypothetical protein
MTRSLRFSGYQNCQVIVPMQNAKFGPSNAKFAKIHKSNVKLLESNF